MKIGIIGAGDIASTMADTISRMNEAELYAVASRSKEKAERFARDHRAEKFFGGYEALLSDPNVELIYIATPHSLHAEQMKMCIDAKKPALCEKSFTMNARQAEETVSRARKENVFLAEAIWTRYMPSRKMIDDMIQSGIIGKVFALTANLSYAISEKERILKPELAGGALLDVGVYCLNFALMHFGKNISRMESAALLAPTGVDAMESITLFYDDGRMANLTAGVYARSDRKGIFYGEKGYIVVENINNPRSASAFDSNDNLLKRVEFPAQISGYEYEIRECISAIENKRTESESMPLSSTIEVMRMMDSLRAKWGVSYPQEKRQGDVPRAGA